MKAEQILFALDNYDEGNLKKGIEILSMMGIGVSSVYKAQSRDEITETILSCPEINVIIVSEQLKGFFTINDFRILQTDNRIIIPVISQFKKGNSEAIGYYFNYKFYNLLFDDDNLMSELGNILLNGRTRETAAIYAGIGQAETVRENNQPKVRKSVEGLYTEDTKFTVFDPGERIQPVFSNKAVLIGFCGNDFDFECTLTAISAANYIAAAGNKVALIEPDFSKGNLLDQLIPCLSENNAVSCGKVDYYSLWNLEEGIKPADVVIMDFSGMNNEDSLYLSKMNKVFVCSDIILSKINRSAKHRNNSSFKYSVLYRDNLKDRAGYKEDNFDVFRVCSQELVQMLHATLSGYSINLGDYSNTTYSSIINMINSFNRADFLDYNKNIALVERQTKDTNNNIQSEFEEQAMISQPVMLTPSLPKQAPSPVYEKMKVTQEDKFKKTETSQQLQQIKTMTENSQNTRPLEVNRNYNEVRANNQNVDIHYNTDKTTYRNNTQMDDDKIANEIPEGSMENGIYSKVNPEDYSGYNYNEEYKDEYEQYGDDNVVKETTILNYIDETRSKFRKKLSANQVLCGKETIFITGLKHGCGCTHTGISFAHYIVKNFPENICICHKKGAYDLENKDITEYIKDTDYDSVFGTNRFIIYDCGILGELNADQLVELKRCNIKIMICNGDEKYLGNLSNFIRKLGNTSNEWIFAFNLVTSREKEMLIRRIMDGYKICFIPLHDSEIPPKKVSKLWDSVLKRNLL